MTAYRHATAVVAIADAEIDQEAFDKAAAEQGDAIEALIRHPAPDHDAVVTKLRIMEQEGYSHMMPHIRRDMERLSGGSVVQPPKPDQMQWSFVATTYRCAWALQVSAAEGYIDEDAQQVVEAVKPAFDKLMATPAPDLPALALKLHAVWDRGREVSESDKAAVLNDLRRLARQEG